MKPVKADDEFGFILLPIGTNNWVTVLFVYLTHLHVRVLKNVHVLEITLLLHALAKNRKLKFQNITIKMASLGSDDERCKQPGKSNKETFILSLFDII